MGSNRLSRTRLLNDKELTIKSSSSNSMIESAINRGSYVENSQATCGKVSKKSGKVGGKSGKGLTAWQAESQASALIAIFEAPQCRNFFLKCVYHLTDKEIQEAINYATANITVPTKTSDLTNDSGFVESSDLATVATSGSYNDLSNKPTIPTVNNATLTIQKNGTTVKTFTANASSNVTANITVPTTTSDLTNNSGFISTSDTGVVSASMVVGGETASTLASGALVEVVGTTTGDYNYAWKYADGRLICFQRVSFTNASTVMWGSCYRATYNPATDFAVPFTANPALCLSFDSLNANANTCWPVNVGGSSTTRPQQIYLVRPSGGAIAGTLNIVAYGFWK